MPRRSIQVVGCLGALWLAASCKDRAPSPAEIADRGWRAHELVLLAGERATSCAEAGPAMQRVIATHRQAFVDAVALSDDHARIAEATAFIEQHEQRYLDIETRMIALSDRCAHEPTVVAAFRLMDSP